MASLVNSSAESTAEAEARGTTQRITIYGRLDVF